MSRLEPLLLRIKEICRGDEAGDALGGSLSGANVNFDRIRHVAERRGWRKGEAILAATIP